jgi:hypothetical protein
MASISAMNMLLMVKRFTGKLAEKLDVLVRD